MYPHIRARSHFKGNKRVTRRRERGRAAGRSARAACDASRISAAPDRARIGRVHPSSFPALRAWGARALMSQFNGITGIVWSKSFKRLMKNARSAGYRARWWRVLRYSTPVDNDNGTRHTASVRSSARARYHVAPLLRGNIVTRDPRSASRH